MTPAILVRLRDPRRFPDIGARIGTIVAIDGVPVVEWPGVEGRVWVKQELLEEVHENV